MKMVKKVLITIIIVLLIFSKNILAGTDYLYLNDLEPNLENVKAEFILLYNLNDGKIVYEKNSNEKIAIASLTKIMTVLTTILQTEDLDKKVIIPEEAFANLSGYAKAGFTQGDVVTIRDLLYATILPSGAEAAQSLAILTSGSISNFVEEMNKLKSKLGLENTHFSNPVGKDEEGNYSTLDDLKTLLLYALENDTFYEIYTTRFYKTTNNLELYSTLVGPSSKYYLNVEEIKGSKSGFTNQAGLCLSSISEHNGINYLLIIAGSLYEDGFPNHIVDSLNIYNYFFDNYSYYNILTENQELISLDIKDGIDNNYVIKSDKNVSFYLKNEMIDKLEYKYTGINKLNSKVKQNDKLGSISILYNNDVLYEYDVFLTDNIKYKHTNLIIMIIIFSILILLLLLKSKKYKKRRKK